MIYAAWQAALAGHDRLTFVELGVANGHGLQAMADFADNIQHSLGISVDVLGFDSGQGLTEIKDHRDHPEIWHQTQFSSIDQQQLEKSFRGRARMVWGDVADTIPAYVPSHSEHAPLGFVSIDLDLYSSTTAAWPLFEMPAQHYIPAVSVYVDDAHTHLTFNPWCGELLSLHEFNACHPWRKFEEKNPCWNAQNFHGFHVLDHPMRNNQAKPKYPIDCCPIHPGL